MRKCHLPSQAQARVDVPAFRRRLLRWYRAAARDMPWRRTRDPYAIWVAEVMLQQTRVDVATPYYERWMERFPTVGALAAADLEDVLRAWSGLGYYSRARSLHEAATIVVAEHGGHVPASAEGLVALPGIGAYTAAAIASIAHGEPIAVVDGNVERVVARLALLRGDPKRAANARTIRSLAGSWLAPRAAGAWNQAMMELGATVCTPRSPRCDVCPVAVLCAAKAAGMQAQVPANRKAAPPRVERPRFAVVQQAGRVLLVRNPGKGLLAGMWSLPGGSGARPLATLVREQSGVTIRVQGRAARARHQFSHRTWDMTVRCAHVTGGVAARGPHREVRWVLAAALAGEALPAAMRTALAAVGIQGRA